MRIDRTGNVGIGTTSPWKKLSVTGTVGFDGLTPGAGAGSLCLDANKQVVYSDNAGCTGSSLRFKHTIETLDGTSGIVETMKLNPVSFVYNDDIGVKGTQVGFIAEEVAQVDTRLVTYDAGGTPANVKYTNMVAIAIEAIQELIAKVTELASVVAAFADHFTTKELMFTRATGEEIVVKKMCVQKTDGTLVCVNGDQLAAVLGLAGQSPVSLPTPVATTSPETSDAATPSINSGQASSPAVTESAPPVTEEEPEPTPTALTAADSPPPEPAPAETATSTP